VGTRVRHGRARSVLRLACTQVALREVVSCTAATDRRSRAVMERLGTHGDPAEDFDHPTRVGPRAHPPHVLYRLTEPEWAATASR
jgi:RimJ/RimL family protein N-acetyltransferase